MYDMTNWYDSSFNKIDTTTFENSIILTPKSFKAFIARRLAEGEEDIKMGRIYGPFDSVDAFKKSLSRRKKSR